MLKIWIVRLKNAALPVRTFYTAIRSARKRHLDARDSQINFHPCGLWKWNRSDCTPFSWKIIWDKAWRADPCRMPLALTLQRKNPTGGGSIVWQFELSCGTNDIGQSQEARGEEAYAIPLYNLWVQLAVRRIQWEKYNKKKAHRCMARSP